jgi:hypothetical protein
VTPVPVENKAADESHSVRANEGEYDVDERDVEDDAEKTPTRLEDGCLLN